MRNIVVNKEYTASRCEICHQEDCFDALSNTCQRCKDIRVPITTANSTKKQLDFGEIGLVPQIICYAVNYLKACEYITNNANRSKTIK